MSESQSGLNLMRCNGGDRCPLMDDPESWAEYRRLILDKLGYVAGQLDSVKLNQGDLCARMIQQVTEIRIEIEKRISAVESTVAGLKGAATAWGAAAGLAVSIVGIIVSAVISVVTK